MTKSLAMLIGAGAMAVALSGAAHADTNSVLSTCSAQYKVDKAASKIPADQTWPQYYSACAAKAKADAGTTATTTTATATTTATTTTKPAASTTATTTKPATTTTTTKPAATTAATTTDTTGGSTTLATCSAQYKVDKAANKVPAGQTWPQYYSGCSAALKAGTAATTTAATTTTTVDATDATPPEPTATAASAATSTTDANGKTLSAGQIAARARIKQCGALWQADKAASKIPAGQTWPKYWSACNTKLKAGN